MGYDLLTLLQANMVLWYLGNEILSDQDRNNIQAFNLLVKGKVTRSAFNQMQFTFHHKIHLQSEYVIFCHAIQLTHTVPVKYDCCPNLCILYTVQYSLLPSCPYCNEAHFKSNSKPHCQFVYFPLIPHLQGFFQSKRMVDLMDYCTTFKRTGDKIHNVFNNEHYNKLCRKHVIVDGVKLYHQYFSDPCNIALALCTDSYCYSKIGKMD